MDRELLLIGWKERIDFPAWGIKSVRAKIDTGARTTALNVCEHQLIEVGPGRFRVRFRPVLSRKKCEVPRDTIEAEVVKMVRVRNTSGTAELRPVVETEVKLGRVVKRIRVTLTDRSRMISPVILGRNALAGDFVVDVEQKYLQKRKRSEQK
jgi:hypothetical protein